jgi:hypothetical protein
MNLFDFQFKVDFAASPAAASRSGLSFMASERDLISYHRLGFFLVTRTKIFAVISSLLLPVKRFPE